MVTQYPDKLIYYTSESNGVDEWGVPIETLTEHTLIGRFEDYNKSYKSFVDKGGVEVQANGKYLVKIGQELPPRFVTTEVRGIKFEILQVYQGQLNATIYLKEVK